jgi:hypothetical protein
MNSIESRRRSVQGEKNSSITRVRPFFQALLRRDPTGKEWLPKLLSLSKKVPLSLSGNLGVLLPWVAEARQYKDRVLKKPPYNIPSIELEKCFERSLPPPQAFLHWLIDHASPEAWEKKRLNNVRENTREWRDKLFGLKGADARREAICAARDLLDDRKSDNSEKQWWAFEGFTEVDCYLETDRMILLIEGKRTEPLSQSTDWYDGRNQLLRNVEAIAERAGGKEFGVILLSEAPMEAPSERMIAGSFPHLEEQQREPLMRHFWGCYTWAEACGATGVNLNDLPKTAMEALK